MPDILLLCCSAGISILWTGNASHLPNWPYQATSENVGQAVQLGCCPKTIMSGKHSNTCKPCDDRESCPHSPNGVKSWEQGIGVYAEHGGFKGAPNSTGWRSQAPVWCVLVISYLTKRIIHHRRCTMHDAVCIPRKQTHIKPRALPPAPVLVLLAITVSSLLVRLQRRRCRQLQDVHQLRQISLDTALLSYLQVLGLQWQLRYAVNKSVSRAISNTRAEVLNQVKQ